MSRIIRTGTIEEAVTLSRLIPEFSNPYPEQVYRERLNERLHLILIAESEGLATGFKAGYDRYRNGSFYTWIGGVLPAFRGQQVYQQLTAEMELWAKEKGYEAIELKTRNRLKPMIRFCLANGYYVSGFSGRPNPAESRIYFRKNLV